MLVSWTAKLCFLFFQVDCVRIELNCRTLSWCLERIGALVGLGKSLYILVSEVLNLVMVEIRGRSRIHLFKVTCQFESKIWDTEQKAVAENERSYAELSAARLGQEDNTGIQISQGEEVMGELLAFLPLVTPLGFQSLMFTLESLHSLIGLRWTA